MIQLSILKYKDFTQLQKSGPKPKNSSALFMNEKTEAIWIGSKAHSKEIFHQGEKIKLESDREI